MIRRTILLFSSVFLFACGKARPLETENRRCATWKQGIGALLQERCGGCHSGNNYDLTSYLGALSPGTDDIANAIAGDATSRIVQVLETATADDKHRAFQDLLPTLRDWVTTCRLAYSPSPIHPKGILNPADREEFHGVLLRQEGWDFALCATCHGSDWTGGKAEASCLSCHAAGPTDCQTCHQKTLRTGAHAAHVKPQALGKAWDCSECHLKPTHYKDVGHLFLANGHVDEPPAEIQFGARAQTTLDPTQRKGLPLWDGTTGTCLNVYCHGDALGDDTQATNTRPIWTAAGQASCGTCHGLPPSNHASDACAICHPDGIANPELHVNGRVDLGDGSGGCVACHGGLSGPAPPRDLSGNTLPSSLGVGAHQSHLQASRLRGPIPCGDCHRVPEKVESPGHLDSKLPAEVTFGGVAVARDAVPTWDRVAATCSGVACHGAATPKWTQVGVGIATCGTCHGIPPQDDTHESDLKLTDCASCHDKTVDAFGNIVLTGAPGAETSAHINGVVDGP